MLRRALTLAAVLAVAGASLCLTGCANRPTHPTRATFDGYDVANIWKRCVAGINEAVPHDFVEGSPILQNFSMQGLGATGIEPFDISLTVPVSSNGFSYNSAMVCFVSGGAHNHDIVTVDLYGL